MLLLIVVLIMLQMQDIRKLLVIMLTAPMGIIGVIFGLLLFNSALGFMAELGILALTGTIIRNSMVLVDQIQQHLDAGMEPAKAITESAIVRFRPIMLAAFTTVLGLIPQPVLECNGCSYCLRPDRCNAADAGGTAGAVCNCV